MYVTEGKAAADVVDGRGNSVFKGEIRKGQLLVIPQYYVATKQAAAGSEGFESIEFTTNEKSIAFPLAGVNSLISSTPEDVLASAYSLTQNAVRAIKFSQSQGILVTPLPN